MSKTIVVLANSKKPSGRCIAGRAVIKRKGQLQFGGWIRPVSSMGGIRLTDSKFEEGGQPQLLDIVRVPITKHDPKKEQPENYLIDPQYYWEKKGRLSPTKLVELVEEPDTLWLRDALHSDYVTAESIVEKPPDQSLYFIRSEILILNLYWWSGRKQTKAMFHYRGINYNLKVTDPAVLRFAERQFPEQGASDKRLTLPNSDNYYLCISLAGEWKNKHYKLVAGIIDASEQSIE